MIEIRRTPLARSLSVDDLVDSAPTFSFGLQSLILNDDPDPVDCAKMSGPKSPCRETILFCR